MDASQDELLGRDARYTQKRASPDLSSDEESAVREAPVLSSDEEASDSNTNSGNSMTGVQQDTLPIGRLFVNNRNSSFTHACARGQHV
eukprot:CAMPEP_0119319004 /NCGR_PEP_ID=MMETSP1333-20130426/48246_1 /TAXON_ID=418940 /ORGANISM="Scyphosphaera apsteinii, Strain RCC1455" /LENGTH=87 /DNA_ID=CAMNT_0007325323 /DNA_START=27 /DNA_END=291 /DNA_ORIENTATION=+